ncbi:MAG: hypothetical protein NUV91_09435 [Candidatus Omnitrophica bacterium]|nr:hypothetical protein [Candidatus Omnitrophota bacterium]
MKKILGFVFILFLLAVGIVVFRDPFLKFFIRQAVRTATGVPLHIESLKTDLKNSSILIQGLTLMNSPAYPSGEMIRVPEVYVDYEFPTSSQKGLHFKELRLDVSEIVVIRNREGEINLNHLKPKMIRDREKQAAAEHTPRRNLVMAIDLLDLKVDRVILKDDRSRSEPTIREFDVRIHERFENVSSLQDVLRLVIFKALSKTTINDLIDFDLEVWAVAGVLGTARKITEGTVGVAADILKNTTQGIKDVIAAPFGQ